MNTDIHIHRLSEDKRLSSRSNYQFFQEFLGCEPKSSVGNTDVAAMGNGADGHSTRSAQKLVASILDFSLKNLMKTQGFGEKSPVVRKLVESLIWPFVARISLRKIPLTNKELGRLSSSMRKTAERITEVVSEDNKEQTFLKYWLDYYLCLGFKDNQFPVREEFIKKSLFEGWLKRFVARAVAKRDISFLYSLQKGSKRLWPVLGKVKRDLALQKHRDRISKDHGPVPEDLFQVINKTSKRILNREGGKLPTLTKFLPTGSACLQATRQMGGALSLTDRFNCPLDSEVPSIIGKLPFLNNELNVWRQKEYNKMLLKAKQRLAWEPPINLNFEYAMRSTAPPALHIQVVPVPEPGKFRIISKGDGYLYSALQPLQGLLLQRWKSSPYATMRDQDLTDRVRAIDRALPDVPYWCSVDYEAATDLLKKTCSFAAFQACEGLPSYELGRQSFKPGYASYPKDSGLEDCYAIEGQLMGHPLSFPLLCIINLSVYRCALTRWVDQGKDRFEVARRRALKRRLYSEVLVNGDDMLFKCESSFYPIFLSTANDAGFKISQGKNYLSPDTCMINSQVFQRRGQVMKRFGYLNLKLLTGESLKGGPSLAVPTQIARAVNDMCSLCPWTQCVIPAILSRWDKDYFGPVFRPNWYLPVHLGGIGVDFKFARPTWKLTKDQREFAARFVHDPSMTLYRTGTLDIPTAKIAGALMKWRLVKNVPMVEGPSELRAEEVSSDEWLARLALAARAHHGSQPISDKVLASRFRKQYRLKPMSLETMADYWKCSLVSSQLPLCPPLSGIRYLWTQ